MIARHLKRLPISRRNWLGVGAVALIAAGLLFLGTSLTAHPHISRQQAIQAALKYGNGRSYPRVEAKYMHYRDLVNGDHTFGTNDADNFVWVVAVSGRYGISPVGRPTWGVAVMKDEFGTGNAAIFESGVSGDWPPFFDNLPDLARD